jgi:hypothetical protein
MKKLLLPIILLITAFTAAKAQDKLCKDITKTVENSTVTYTAPTPGWPFGKDVMEFSLFKVVQAGSSQMYLTIAYNTSNPHETSTDVSVKFDNDSLLTFSNVILNVRPGNFVYGVQWYLYTTTVPLTNSDIQKLKTKKVTRYTVVGRTGAPPPLCNFKDRIQAYANCLDALTPSPDEIDPAKLISKKFDDMKNITTYSSPATENIQVIKTIDSSGPLTAVWFYAYKSIPDDKQQTVYVKFDDGKVLNFPAVSSCSKAGRGQYLYTCGVTLSPDNIQNFKNKKIIKFQIADTDVMVDNTLGLSVNTWVNGVENLK